MTLVARAHTIYYNNTVYSIFVFSRHPECRVVASAADGGRRAGGRRRAKTRETETPADRVLERTTDALGGVVHGQPIPEQGQAHRLGAHAQTDRETNQDMVPEPSHEREKVQKRFG